MRKLERIPVTKLRRDENQPRKLFEESIIAGLAASLKAVGQQVPLIVYPVADGWQICDGECRWRAAQLAGITELDCVVVDKQPSTADLILVQASIDLQRNDLKPTERGAMLRRITQEKGWTLTEACKHLAFSQSMGSKLMAIDENLAPQLKADLDAGKLRIEEAYTISREPDPAKQMELAKAAGTLSREALRKRANGQKATDEVKLTSATFSMPGGYVIAMRGGQLDLANAVEVLTETVRILKKGLQQGLSIASQVKMMKDTAKAK